MKASRASAAGNAAAAAAVVAAIALAIALIRPSFEKPLGWDALHVYLPMARGLLAEGWAFMQRPDSLMTGPFAYVYPALLGAGETTLRWANVALFSAAIALGFLATRRAHSLQAGIAAAFMLAISPTARPFIGDVITEPPFFFLTMVWALAIAFTLSPALGGRGRTAAWVVMGGVALGLATLTRPAVMYFAPMMVVVLGLWWWKTRRGELGPLAAMHAIALAIGAAWIVRNAITFGFPAIATGAGAALWFGVNPLVDGYDPVYFGMFFDSGNVQEAESHLSIAGDLNLRAAAWLEFRDTPVRVLARMFLHKTAAFLFTSSAEYSNVPLPLLRAWRIALVALAVLAIAFRHRSVFVVTLAALIAYMVAVHAPVMYSLRYSVGAIEIPLTLLAAIGLAEVAGSATRAAIAAAAIVIGVGLGVADAARAAPHSPMPERIPHDVAWLRNVGSVFEAGPGRAPIDIPIEKDPRSLAWDISMMEIDVAVKPLSPQAECGWMRLRYRNADEKDFAPRRVARVPLEPDGRMRTLRIGTSYPLFLSEGGMARLEFECAAPASVEIGKMVIITSQRQRHYLQLRHQQGHQ